MRLFSILLITMLSCALSSAVFAACRSFSFSKVPYGSFSVTIPIYAGPPKSPEEERARLLADHRESLGRYLACYEKFGRLREKSEASEGKGSSRREAYNRGMERYSLEHLFTRQPRYKKRWGNTYDAPQAVELILGLALVEDLTRVKEVHSGYGFNSVYAAALKGEEDMKIEWESSDPGTDSIVGRDHPWFKGSSFFELPERKSAVEAVEQTNISMERVLLTFFSPSSSKEVGLDHLAAVKKFAACRGTHLAIVGPQDFGAENFRDYMKNTSNFLLDSLLELGNFEGEKKQYLFLYKARGTTESIFDFEFGI